MLCGDGDGLGGSDGRARGGFGHGQGQGLGGLDARGDGGLVVGGAQGARRLGHLRDLEDINDVVPGHWLERVSGRTLVLQLGRYHTFVGAGRRHHGDGDWGPTRCRKGGSGTA